MDPICNSSGVPSISKLFRIGANRLRRDGNLCSSSRDHMRPFQISSSVIRLQLTPSERTRRKELTCSSRSPNGFNLKVVTTTTIHFR